MAARFGLRLHLVICRPGYQRLRQRAWALFLSLAGCVGWFREVFPHEHEEAVAVVPEDIRVTTARRIVERLPLAKTTCARGFPLETYPVSAGLKGGLAGSVAMAVLACAYGS